MKNKLIKRFFPFAAAAVIAGFLLYLFWGSVDAEMTVSYDAVVLGDSIIGKEHDGSGVHYYFQEASGFTMYNGAFGGNCASAGEKDNHYSYNEESLSLCRMAEAICSRDFGVQLADIGASQVKLDYFKETMEGLAGIDFEQVDMLLLEFGFNDYSSGRRLDNPEDPYDVYTCGGAMRYAIELFQKTYPDLRIVIVTPCYCWISGYEDCTKEDFGYGTLEKYVALEKEIAAEYGVDVVDIFYGLGFNESNIFSYTQDGIHLNPEGRRVYGTFLGEKVRELPDTEEKEGNQS